MLMPMMKPRSPSPALPRLRLAGNAEDPPAMADKLPITAAMRRLEVSGFLISNAFYQVG